MEATTHIAIVSVPLYSHLRSILEFSKRLVHLHQDIHVTCINPTFGYPCNNIKTLFEALPPTIDHMFLPPVDLEDLPKESTHPVLQVKATISRSLPSIQDALETLHSSSSRPVAVVADGFITEVLLLAKNLNISAYTYFPSTTMLLSLCLYSSKLDKIISSEYKDLLDLIEIPGCIPIRRTDLIDTLQDRSRVGYNEFLEANERFYLAEGIFVNSFLDLEEVTIKTLQQQQEGAGMFPSVYPIGPSVQNVSCGDHGSSDMMRWLDKQEQNSILYVSFGSGGTLSLDQINELALGLELSGQKFLWVLRPPNQFGIISDHAGAGADENEDPFQFLPNGFLKRTEEQGLVVPYWAPQIEILGHSATAGFLCHCGWNSTLESVVHGIPLIALPLFAEQKMNAALLTDGLKVALRLKVNDKKGVVEREEIAEVIKNLMVGEEGKGIRQRMKKLKGAAGDAMKEDGSSTRTLTQVAIVVVSVPIVSHQIAISGFCKRLLHLHPNFHITFILPVLDSLPSASKSITVALSSLNIDTIVLPPVNSPPKTAPPLKLPLAMSQSLPSILNALNSIFTTSSTTSSSQQAVAIVADYFAYEVFPFAKKHNILSYTYFPSAATLLSLCFHSSVLHQTFSCEFRDLKEPIQSIPGCIPIHGSKVLNCGPHHLMRPQYCGCGGHRNRITPQLRCDLKSRETAAT